MCLTEAGHRVLDCERISLVELKFSEFFALEALEAQFKIPKFKNREVSKKLKVWAKTPFPKV